VSNEGDAGRGIGGGAQSIGKSKKEGLRSGITKILINYCGK